MPNTISQISERLAKAAVSERLDYSVGKSTDALITRRDINYFPSECSSYGPSNVITINLSTTAFIDPRNSFLLFKFAPESPHLCFSEHGVFSLIDRIRLSLQTGQALEEVESFSNLMHFLLPWTSDKDYLENYGQVWGQGSYDMGTNFEYKEVVSGVVTQNGTKDVTDCKVSVPLTASLSQTPYKPYSRGQLLMEQAYMNRGKGGQSFAIPLSMLCGIFNIKQYLYLGGMGALKLEIYLNSTENALHYLGSEIKVKNTVVAPSGSLTSKVEKHYPLQPCKENDAKAARTVLTGALTDAKSAAEAANLNPHGYQEYDFVGTKDYKVSEVQLVVESLTINDATSAMLKAELANKSLVQQYDTWFTVTNNVNPPHLNFVISRASYCIKTLAFLLKDRKKMQSLAYDSHGSIPLDQIFQNFQVQLGSQFLPMRDITSLEEAFTHTRRAFNLLHTSDLSSVSLDEYKYGNKGLIALSTEKDDSSPLTGLSTANGLSINCRIGMKAPDNYWTQGAVLNAFPEMDVLTFILYTRLFVFGANGSEHQIFE